MRTMKTIRSRLRDAKDALLGEERVYGYTLRADTGMILYVGITNNIRARVAEHRVDGKLFHHHVIETKGMSRVEAAQWETKTLRRFRGMKGALPSYNRTVDGK